MTKEDIIEYVMHTPENTNPNVLTHILDEVAPLAAWFSGKLRVYENDEIEFLKPYVFSKQNLEKVSIPKVTLIPEYCFQQNNLKDFISETVLSVGTQSFSNNPSLDRIVLLNVQTIGDFCFANCYNLKETDLGKCTKIGNRAFISCEKLSKIILRNTSEVCLYESDSYGDPTNKLLKIYVPKDLLSQYKTAKNWTRLKDKMFPLEDYTVDGTVFGALKEGE